MQQYHRSSTASKAKDKKEVVEPINKMHGKLKHTKNQVNTVLHDLAKYQRSALAVCANVFFRLLQCSFARREVEISMNKMHMMKEKLAQTQKVSCFEMFNRLHNKKY